MTHPVIADVTNRIATRSAEQRGTYLERLVAATEKGPAEAAGGAPYLRAIHSPVPFARFCPTGGITPTNIADYLKTPNVGCVGGSWLTPADAVEHGDWERISSLATVALELASPTPEPLGGDIQ